MKNTYLSCAALLLAACGGGSAPSDTSRLDWTEPADLVATDATLWSDVAGTRASFGSVDVRYPRAVPFLGEQRDGATLAGWRGERLSAQLVVWTAEGLEGLRCTVGDFTSDSGAKLAGIGRARFVKYVISDSFLPEMPCGARPADNPAHLEPDLLSEEATLDLAAATLRPVWITVDIPADAQPGRYRSTVEVAAKGFEQQLDLELEVVDRLLPPPSEWAYHLDLWQHPSSVAEIEGLEMWSDAHFRAMEPTMRLLAEAGQKVITATLNKDPWNCQTEFPYADMIVWTRLGDGSWEYDFTVFDRWVEFMMGLGIDKAINCYSLLPWNSELHYTDEVTGQTVTVSAPPASAEFRELWKPFLEAFSAHLAGKGWLGITNIAMDERSPEDMAAAVALLEETAPELGIALADNHFSYRRYPQIQDMCVSIFADMDPADILGRRAEGKVSTYYVCCSSGFPNTYTSSQPLEAVYLSWFALAHDYDGFLRWAYNSWTADPIRDSRFRNWAAGDTYMVYPEGRSSIRFERLREGIQDWVKATQLRRELALSSRADAREQAARLEEAIAACGDRMPFEGWQDKLNAAKRLLNELAR